MFSRKKKVPVQKSTNRQRAPLDFGIPGIAGFDPNIQEDESELEAELLALTGGRKQKSEDAELALESEEEDLEAELSRILGGSTNKKSKPIQQHPSKEKPAPPLKPTVDYDETANSDEDIDENDPELLGELQMLTCEDEEINEHEEDTGEEGKEEDEEDIPSQRDFLKSRLDVYRAAERNAKANNESAKARRFNRGVKTLENLLRRAEQGEVVPPDEIPPEIARPGPPADVKTNEAPTRQPSVAPQPASPIKLEEPGPLSVQETKESLDEPSAEEHSDTASCSKEENPVAFRCERTDSVLKSEELSVVEPEPRLPASPSSLPSKTASILEKLKTRRDQYKRCALAAKNKGDKLAALENVRMVKGIESLMGKVENGEKVTEDQIPSPPLEKPLASLPRKPAPAPPINRPGIVLMTAEVFNVPKTVTEALHQRLDYYTKMLKKAETAGLRTEAKKWADIVRLYQNSIRLHQRGSNVPFERLPTPPGCPPIPLVFQI